MSGGGSGTAHPPVTRVRRPNDLVQLLAAAVGLGLIVLLTLQTPDAVATLDRTVPTVARDPLRTVLSVASVAASLATLGVLLTVAVDAARHRRAALVQALVAGVLGLALGADDLVGRSGGGDTGRQAHGQAGDRAQQDRRDRSFQGEVAQRHAARQPGQHRPPAGLPPAPPPLEVRPHEEGDRGHHRHQRGVGARAGQHVGDDATGRVADALPHRAQAQPEEAGDQRLHQGGPPVPRGVDGDGEEDGQRGQRGDDRGEGEQRPERVAHDRGHGAVERRDGVGGLQREQHDQAQPGRRAEQLHDVVRAPDPGDRRVCRLAATPAHRAIIPERRPGAWDRDASPPVRGAVPRTDAVGGAG